MANLALPLLWARSRPNHGQYLKDRTDRLELRHDEHAWTRLSRIQAIPEMSGHGSPIMGNEDSPLFRRHLQDLWVAPADEPGLCG